MGGGRDPSPYPRRTVIASRRTCEVALCDPMDCGLPGSSVHGIFQARVLEWVPSPGKSSQPRDQTQSPTLQADALPSEPPGKRQGEEHLIETLS